LSLVDETQMLRETFAAWAADPEWALLCRYDLLREQTPRSLSDRWFRRLKNMLAGFGLVPPHVTKYSWLPTLKHAQPDGEAEILLIWALGVGREDLRASCEGFRKRLEGISGMVPVLVTDTADFAYFSRLQWLVEYIPPLSGEGVPYHARKQHYLAWRYRDALVVPASVGRACESEWNNVMRMKH
jgi:hypothetical protein